MAFRIMSAFFWLNMNVLLILMLKMADHYTPVLAAGGDIDGALQEPTVPLLKYLKISKFSEGYANLWGGQHQNISADGYSVTIRIDRSSGSGFKSKEAYMYGFFNAAVKLQGGYTAGIITSFYLSNGQVYQGWHDEIDIEFLGTIPGEPYKLHTNVYGNGTGDGNLIGREQQFHLWFDPTQDFHNYSMLWTPSQILFLVDGIPIRRFPKTESLGVIYPSKPMSAYATIWDASSWATDGGRYKANYSYEPFLSTYSNFQTIGCNDNDTYCSKILIDNCLVSPHLNKKQIVDLEYVRKNYMTYDYCQDLQRYPKGTMPECPAVAEQAQLKELNILQNTANQAILEAVEGHDRIHVIDFNLMHGLQWPALIQALALRAGGPPFLRLTGIGPRQPDGRDVLQEIGMKLAQLAESVNVEFDFRGVMADKLDDVKPWMLQLRPGEIIAVNSIFQLHRLLYNDPSGSSPIDAVLKSVRSLKPTIVTVVEQEANNNAPLFLDRFTEALHYYSTMFDSLEACNLPPHSTEKLLAEMYIEKEICNIVACEGPFRVERHEPLSQWRMRLGSAGFRPAHLGSNAFKQASMLLTLFSGEGFTVEENNGSLTLGWHSRPLISASAWQGF